MHLNWCLLWPSTMPESISRTVHLRHKVLPHRFRIVWEAENAFVGVDGMGVMRRRRILIPMRIMVRILAMRLRRAMVVGTSQLKRGKLVVPIIDRERRRYCRGAVALHMKP